MSTKPEDIPTPKHVECEYIESGTFVSGEEDCFLAEIKSGMVCVAMTKATFESMRSELAALREDKADLDWREANPYVKFSYHEKCIGRDRPFWRIVFGPKDASNIFDTLREAIRAARKGAA